MISFHLRNPTPDKEVLSVFFKLICKEYKHDTEFGMKARTCNKPFPFLFISDDRDEKLGHKLHLPTQDTISEPVLLVHTRELDKILIFNNSTAVRTNGTVLQQTIG